MSQITAPVYLPTVDATNYQSVMTEYGHIPMPAELVDLLPEYDLQHGTGYFERADVLDDGHPTNWFAWKEEDGTWSMSLNDNLPCSVTWCAGHGTNDSDTWGGAMHWTADVTVKGLNCGVGIVAWEDRVALNAYLDLAEEIELDEIEPLKARLLQLVAVLESQAERARTIRDGAL